MSTWSYPLEFGWGVGFDTTIHFSECIDEDSGYAQGPERNLLSAILFDGIQAYMNYVCAEKESEQSQYEEAVQWVFRCDDDYVFSFRSVCEGLGVNPEYLRSGLLNAANSQSLVWRRMHRVS
ncbi:MAG: hypothetical protein ACO3XO_06170 [Bdellovibrionota bacterium]